MCLIAGYFAGEVFAQVAPPKPGVKIPAAFYERLDESPTAFRFEKAWLARAQEIFLSGQSGGLKKENASGVQQQSFTGTREVPVFPVLFSNVAAPPFPAAQLQQQLFDGPWPTATLSEYYLENSYGQFTFGGTVFDWTPLSSDDAYYAGNSSGLGSDANIGQLLRETLLANDAHIDFGRYDNDGPDGIPNSGDDDGFVDFITIVQPLSGGECGNGNIWSHRWTYGAWWNGADFVTNDPAGGGGSIRIRDYVIAPGLNCDSADMIAKGIFCHEFGHALGLPDLYDLDQSSAGLGSWCLMASGNWSTPDTPAHLSAWCKQRLGWLQLDGVSLPDSSATGWERALILPVISAENQALKIHPGSDLNEYFLLSYRTRSGFDQHLPGEGLLIWHIDERKTSNREEWLPGQDPQRHYWVALEQADGAWDLENNRNRGDAGDPFRAAGFNCNSTPGCQTYHSNGLPFNIDHLQATPAGMRLVINGECRAAEIAVTPATLQWRERGDSLRAELEIRNVAPAGAPVLSWHIIKRSDTTAAQNRRAGGLIDFLAMNPVVSAPPPSAKGEADLRVVNASVLQQQNSFGYRWQSNNGSDDLRFAWTDISRIGTLLDLGDDAAVAVPLPFEFPFYGGMFSSVNVSSNGFLTFGVDGAAYLHQYLPDPASPNGVIAGFWRDLNPAAGGTVSHFFDEAANCWMVQYEQIPAYGGNGTYTFQIILYPGGDIGLNYKAMRGLLTTGSVGIESPDGGEGLPLMFNGSFVHDTLAVRILPPDDFPWLQVRPSAGLIRPGENQVVTIAYHGDDFTGITQTGKISLYNNSKNNGLLEIPFKLQQPQRITADVRVILEGAFDGAQMRTDLAQSQLLPEQQPFNAAPWFYAGEEHLSAGVTVVDWLLVSLHKSADGSDVVARKAGVLHLDGRITEASGNGALQFSNVTPGEYFLRVSHRNHLPVTTAEPLAVSDRIVVDFSQRAMLAGQALVELLPGIRGMRSGDANSDGGVDVRDKNLFWNVQQGRGGGYFSADFNLDGRVDLADLLLWRKNNGISSFASPAKD